MTHRGVQWGFGQKNRSPNTEGEGKGQKSKGQLSHLLPSLRKSGAYRTLGNHHWWSQLPPVPREVLQEQIFRTGTTQPLGMFRGAPLLSHRKQKVLPQSEKQLKTQLPLFLMPDLRGMPLISEIQQETMEVKDSGECGSQASNPWDKGGV